MAPRTISDLPKPPRKFNPAHATQAGFETKSASRQEDRRRVQGLEGYLRRYVKHAETKAPNEAHLREVSGVQAVITSINAGVGLASSVYMRKHRIRITGELWRHVKTSNFKSRTFTLIPRHWCVEVGDLHKVNPRRLLKQVRQALLRVGATDLNGWLFLALHGEFDPSTGCYRPHIHGIAFGPVIKAVDRLRRKRAFRRSDGVYRPIRIDRPLTDLPAPLTYRLQSFWPAKATVITSKGKRRRQRTKQRIGEPHHTEVLTWLNRWRLEDITTLVGATVKLGGIRINKKCARIDQG